MAINDIFRCKPFQVIAIVTTILKISYHKNFLLLLNSYHVVNHVHSHIRKFPPAPPVYDTLRATAPLVSVPTINEFQLLGGPKQMPQLFLP